MKILGETLQIAICRSEDLSENESREIEEVEHLAFTGPEDDLDWASTAPFYRKLGWQPTQEEVVFDFRGTKRILPEMTMLLLLGDRPWPEGKIDLCGFPW
jgi:hypothetical protein